MCNGTCFHALHDDGNDGEHNALERRRRRTFNDVDNDDDAASAFGASTSRAEPKVPSPQSSPRIPRPLAGSMGTLASLDMGLVKRDLMDLSGRDDDGVGCALLLQALRWRFERGLSFQVRARA